MKYETVDFGEPVGSLSGCTQNTSVLMPVSGSKARILLNNTMNPEVMKIESIILKTDSEAGLFQYSLGFGRQFRIDSY